MNVDKLREVIRDNTPIGKETSKNIICRCIYCGDHQKISESHCYVSIDPEVPVIHCFLCNFSTTLPVFLKDLSVSRELSEQILPKSEFEKSYQSQNLRNLKRYPNLKVLQLN